MLLVLEDAEEELDDESVDRLVTGGTALESRGADGEAPGCSKLNLV